MTWSLWLLPCAQDAMTLQRTCDQLCDEQGMERFPVHLTVLSGINGERDHLQNIAQSIHCVNSDACGDGVHTEEKFYRCVFLRVNSENIHVLQQQAQRAFGMGKIPPILHISLAYGEVPRETREHLVTRITKLPSNITFDRLQLVRTDGHYTTWEYLPPTPLA